MELTAIYHRPESEYAYLYKEGQLHIRIRTKKNDVQQVILHYGDPFIFIGDKYEAKKEMTKVTSDALFDYWQVTVSVDFARIQYLFELLDEEGQGVLYGDKGCVEHTQENLDAAIIPNRDDFFGGDLQGIIDHLDYLKDLGITGLYLCPIFEATTNHKYDTTDYFEIDRHFGDKEVFATLVEEAHKRGIKIMLDAVFNHIGDQSAQWQDVLKNGEKSPYKDWFHIQEFPITEDKLKNARELPYHTFAFANEIDHQFWKDFRKAVLAKKPDLYILGEIWHTSQPWLKGDEFHAVMNYPLSESIKDYFLRQHKKTEQFISEINSQSMYYKQQISEVMFNLLDSHDTERILTTPLAMTIISGENFWL